MDFRIAIPSYNRVNELGNKTLSLLKRHSIDFKFIDLFVENKEQFDKYSEAFPSLNIITTNTMGIKGKRNYMRKFYRNQTICDNILFIDDDIDDVFQMSEPVENLNEFIEYAFNETKKRGLCLWGVCCFDNVFFMRENISTNLKYICGGFHGLIIDRSKELLLTNFNHYEDFEFSVLHFKRDKGVVRFNDYCVKTKIFTEGGICDSYGGLDERKKDMEIAGKKFVEMYPKYSRLIKKKYGYDIRLNFRAKSI